MENQNEPSSWATKDFTLPLLLSGVVSTVVCVVLCGAMYVSRDYLNNDLAPQLGLVEPTPTPIPCPAIPAEWKMVMNNNFDSNKYGWHIGKKSNSYANSNLQVVDGLLRFDITAKKSVFSNWFPYQNISEDFYVTSQVRKVIGPIDAEYGLTFRINGDQILFFAIQDSGIMRVGVRDIKNKWQDNLLIEYSEDIKASENNELVVIGLGSHYTFCINEVFVAETTNTTYQYGKIGIGVELDNINDKASIEYDDFIIYTPPD